MNDTRDLPTLDQLRTRRQMLVGATAALTSLGMGSISALAHIEEEVSRTAESIHQEPVFKANPKRVYEALTDEKQFERVTLLSAAMQSGMAPGNKRTQDRKSTRLNSSHLVISYAVFCLKKKKQNN